VHAIKVMDHACRYMARTTGRPCHVIVTATRARPEVLAAMKRFLGVVLAVEEGAEGRHVLREEARLKAADAWARADPDLHVRYRLNGEKLVVVTGEGSLQGPQ
jgi:hypothetical protein